MKDFVIQYAEWKKECLKSIRKKTRSRNLREMLDREIRLIDANVERYKENPTRTEFYLNNIVELGHYWVVEFEREKEEGERK